MIAEKRIHWIDIAKGFFIIAIVVGHLYDSGQVRWWLFSFHVPAFFFISGFCFCYRENWKFYIKRKIQTIVVPYFVFSLGSIFVFAIAAKFYSGIAAIVECDPMVNIAIMLYGNSKPNVMKYNLPLWFLPCFFCVVVLGYFIERLNNKKRKIRYYTILFCILLGAFFSFHETIALPWHLETAISMLVWYLFGIQVRHWWPEMETLLSGRLRNSAYHYLGAFFLILCGYLLSLLNTRVVGVRNEHYGILPIYYLAAVMGIGGFVWLSFAIEKKRLLEFIGRNSLAILVMHKFPILFFQEMVPFTSSLLKKPDTIAGIICGAVVTVITLTLVLGASQIIERIFPFMLGKEKNGI